LPLWRSAPMQTKKR